MGKKPNRLEDLAFIIKARTHEEKGPLETPCRIWEGGIDGKGYGAVCCEGKKVKVHRFMHETYNGPIPPDYLVLHRCDNPSCCNPDHLFSGTARDNARDRDKKGRQASHKGTLNGRCFLSPDQVKIIKTRLAAGEDYYNIADEYGVNPRTIYSIMTGQNWSHL